MEDVESLLMDAAVAPALGPVIEPLFEDRGVVLDREADALGGGLLREREGVEKIQQRPDVLLALSASVVAHGRGHFVCGGCPDRRGLQLAGADPPDSMAPEQSSPERQIVARVGHDVQWGEDILDVRRLHEAKAAVLHVRDLETPQLELEGERVVSAAIQRACSRSFPASTSSGGSPSCLWVNSRFRNDRDICRMRALARSSAGWVLR